MRTLMLGTMFALCVAAGPVMAQESVVARAVKSCEKDIDTYCGHVKPGEGRLMGCLYSNDNKISSQCGTALNDASLQIEAVVAQVSEVIDACETERETFCPTAEWGHGGVVKCLAMQSHMVESVSMGCRLVLEKFGLI